MQGGPTQDAGVSGHVVIETRCAGGQGRLALSSVLEDGARGSRGHQVHPRIIEVHVVDGRASWQLGDQGIVPRSPVHDVNRLVCPPEREEQRRSRRRERASQKRPGGRAQNVGRTPRCRDVHHASRTSRDDPGVIRANVHINTAAFSRSGNCGAQGSVAYLVVGGHRGEPAGI